MLAKIWRKNQKKCLYKKKTEKIPNIPGWNIKQPVQGEAAREQSKFHIHKLNGNGKKRL